MYTKGKKEQEMEITRVSPFLIIFFLLVVCVCGGPANKRRENGPVAMAIYIRLALQTHKVLTLVKPPKVLSKKKISLASSKKKEKDGPGINELISFCPMATAGRL
jgi:hypothetical protein